MRTHYLLTIACLLLLAGCGAGKNFCATNYGQETQPYYQCMNRYQMQPSLYDYCIRERYITQESHALQQCLAEAPAILAERDRMREERRLIEEEERRYQAELGARQRYEQDRYEEERYHEEERERRHDRRRVRDIYRNADGNDILSCSIVGGYVHVNNDWQLLQDTVRFRIARSESKEIDANSRVFTAGLREDGGLLNICGAKCGGIPVNPSAQPNVRIELFVEELFRHATLECNFTEGGGENEDRNRAHGRDHRR